jgi:hypothetical protein
MGAEKNITNIANLFPNLIKPYKSTQITETNMPYNLMLQLLCQATSHIRVHRFHDKLQFITPRFAKVDVALILSGNKQNNCQLRTTMAELKRTMGRTNGALRPLPINWKRNHNYRC